MRVRSFTAVAFVLTAAPMALAQEFVPPRFEGLEQQQLDLEQRRYDQLEDRRQQERFRAAQPDSSPADSALRQLEIDRQAQRLRLESAEQRASIARETAIREAKLPNRRIAAHSSLVVRDPERYVLPAPPEGQYYARVEGRFVLVDATSELVVAVLDRTPSDPRNDLPRQPLPDPDSEGAPISGAAGAAPPAPRP